MGALQSDADKWVARKGVDFPATIAAIGCADFGAALLRLLHRICGTEHLVIFRRIPETSDILVAHSVDGTDAAASQARLYNADNLWGQDPSFAGGAIQYSGRPSLSYLDAMTTDRGGLRRLLYDQLKLRQRVMICGRAANGDLGLSMLRSADLGTFSAIERTRLDAAATMAFSMAVRHCDIVGRKSGTAKALDDLSKIEDRVRCSASGMSPREVQVAARVIYGMTTEGIALDLEIGRETIITYRKRIYERLVISSNRELTIWYLALYTERVPQLRD